MSFQSESSPPSPPHRWTLRTELLVSHVGLACLSMLVFGGLLLATAVHATYRRAESDLLAAAHELIQDLKHDTSPTQLTISDFYQHRFGMAPRDHAYMAVWDQDGHILFASPQLPSHARPSDTPLPTTGPHPFQTRAAGRCFDVIVATPSGGQLLLGRPLAKEWDALQWLSLQALGLGVLCLAGGAVVARWLAQRLSSPLMQLTTTAERITSRHLHERIPPMNGSREITRLGEVFNEMLSGLDSAFEKQTRFIADASHELRTPVTVVLSQVEHSLHRDRTPEDYRKALEVCLRSSKQMKDLIDKLLFLARADAGKLVLRPTTIDLAEVVSQSLELLRPLAAQHSINLEADLSSAPLVGDPDRLAQVLTNLVANAIRYNRPHGKVHVQTQADGHQVFLRVQDNGIGIPLIDQPRLFDRFYRVDTARTQQEDSGTGLGLSLVREIISAHRGTIDLQSVPGTGTTITVVLPQT